MSFPRIVILDGHTLNPDDLSWSGLEKLGELQIHERTPAALVLPRCLGADIILTNKTVLKGETIRALPELRFIGVLATGYNIVDVATAAECGIPVSNAPGYARASAAQAVFSLLLELATRTGDHSRRVHEGRWTAGPDFCFWDYPLHELAGLTLGIVGYGSIGKSVAVIARAFGMAVIVHSRNPVAGEENVALDNLFARADVVTLHCPLTPQTQHLVNAARLACMKPVPFLSTPDAACWLMKPPWPKRSTPATWQGLVSMSSPRNRRPVTIRCSRPATVPLPRTSRGRHWPRGND